MIAENPIDSAPRLPPSPQRFSLGKVVATPGALAALAFAGQSAAELLSRHQSGDWGGVSTDDAKINDESLDAGERLLSAYRLKDQSKVWVITEADRSSTCILLPDEY